MKRAVRTAAVTAVFLAVSVFASGHSFAHDTDYYRTDYYRYVNPGSWGYRGYGRDGSSGFNGSFHFPNGFVIQNESPSDAWSSPYMFIHYMREWATVADGLYGPGSHESRESGYEMEE